MEHCLALPALCEAVSLQSGQQVTDHVDVVVTGSEVECRIALIGLPIHPFLDPFRLVLRAAIVPNRMFVNDSHREKVILEGTVR